MSEKLEMLKELKKERVEISTLMLRAHNSRLVAVFEDRLLRLDKQIDKLIT